MSEEIITILNWDSYNLWKETHEPLIDSQFDIEINLRKKIQDELFGSDSANPNNRHKFFLWVWEHRNHVCEETGAFLGYTMQADFMSHILTRGAHIEMWNDPRNINLLAPDNHRKWETGKREKMRIWDKNKVIIAQLKLEYSNLKRFKSFTEKLNEPLTEMEKIDIDANNQYQVAKKEFYAIEIDYDSFMLGFRLARTFKQKSN